MKKKLLIVFGTRPEAIKMAPLVQALRACPDYFEVKVAVTAQHRQMLDQVLEFFDVEVDFDLNLMKANQSLFDLTADILKGMKDILSAYCPDFVFVHGDTTTTMASSLASFYGGTKVCHVEAGLRTFNKHAPFPEEMNRLLTGRIADIHFAPTEKAKRNLVAEGISEDVICMTGNTVIDALFLGLARLANKDHKDVGEIKHLVGQKPIILVTGHRRENFGEGFQNICYALKEIAETGLAHIIYPVHMNPNVKDPVFDILENVSNVSLIKPLSYPAFIWLMEKAKLIITDSGGIQEEAPSLGRPVLVMREVTERPEAVDAGTVILVGTDRSKIVHHSIDLLTSEERYRVMSRNHNPYGDGKACERIVSFMKNLVHA